MPTVKTRRKKQVLSYNVYSPNDFRMLMDADGNLTKFLYSSHLWNGDTMMREDIVVVWTDTEHYYRTTGGEQRFFEDNPDGVNPYGEIPVVVMARDEADPFGGGQHSLIESNLKALYYSMLETEDITFAGTSTPVMINFTDPENDRPFGPRELLSVTARDAEVEPKFEYVSGKPSSELIRALAEKEERSAALRMGMSPAMLADQPQELSGKALKNMMMELIEQRQDDAIVMQEYEEELYAKTRIVAETVLGVKLPEEGFNIEFPEMRFNDNPMEELEFAMRLRDEGYLSDLDVFKQFVTDRMTDDEAIASMQQNAVQNRRKAGVAGLFQGTGATEDEASAQRADLLAGQS
jgi:hypothetical protein